MPPKTLFGPVGPDGRRIQGVLTAEGGTLFEVARERLRRLVITTTGHVPATVSDASTVEYLLRGTVRTRAALRSAKGAAK